MFKTLRILSTINLHSSGNNLFFIISKQKLFARQLSTKYQLKQIRLKRYEFIQRNEFHTTEPRKIPPIVAILIRPLVQFGGLIFGRAFKKWWKKKSPEEQKVYINWLKSRKNAFFGFLGFFMIALFVYYITHLQTDPITKRQRFIIFNKEQQEFFEKFTLQMHLEENKGHIVPENHPVYMRLTRIVQRLVNSNKDLQSVNDKQWSLTVVNEKLKNAYVLPGGHIFVFLGALNLVENDDQLAIILAHEMAHELLNHSMEQLSRGVILDILLALPIVFLWAIFPDAVAFICQILGQSVINILHRLPYSRALESEADDVGLILAAKACFDVREAVVFWGIMRMLTELKIEKDIPPLLSSHPDHGDREKHLNELMPNAIALRNNVRCAYLDPRDPRNRFYMRSKEDHELYFKQRGIIST